jgi:polyisoprenyl-phosphate glycosyltransferase
MLIGISMKLSFVFSFRNEEENIKNLVERVHAVCSSMNLDSFEMIFVNDQSDDGSEVLLERLQKKFPVTIINMTRNFGTAPCVLAGLAEADGDAVVYMDSDLQDPPELVPEMFNLFLQGADVVHTKRKSRPGESTTKLLITKLAYKIINMVSEIEIPTNSGDFKLLSRAVVDDILQMTEDDPFMRGLSVWVGRDQRFVYYDRDPREAGTTKFPLFSKNPAHEFIRGVTSFSVWPLYFSLFIGLLVTIAALGFISYALITKITGLGTPGSAGIIIIVCILNGTILISNGIMGVYVAKIFYQVKRRPLYLIKDLKRHK